MTCFLSYLLKRSKAKGIDYWIKWWCWFCYSCKRKLWTDNTNTAKRDGELTFSTGEWVPEFEEAANKLEEGKMTTETGKIWIWLPYHKKWIKKSEKVQLEGETF